MEFMTADTTLPRVLLRARLAVFGLFASFGLVIATWAVHLPSIKQATDVSASMMGWILLILGAGALAGMQLSGALVDRIGSEPVAVVGVAAMAIAVVPPLAVRTWSTAAVGAFFLGLATGLAEVGMNAAAVDVERSYRRPIMASFHAVFSIGNVLGAAVGAAAFGLGIGVVHAGAAVSVVALLVVGAAAAVLVGRRPERPGQGAEEGHPGEQQSPARAGRVFMLGLLAFLLLLSEGSAMDWSSLHAQRHLRASSSSGAIALGCFVSAMTVGRFAADRIVARVGSARVVRWGAVMAVAGLILVMASSLLVLTCVGWALAGLGLSGGLPQVFTAAGNLGAGSGKALSRVVGTGYVAILAGPAVMGWLADVVSLDTAFVLPACGLVICACAAGAVAPTVGPGGPADRDCAGTQAGLADEAAPPRG
jgi:predicted MFS family arabinose efflux permease